VQEAYVMKVLKTWMPLVSLAIMTGCADPTSMEEEEEWASDSAAVISTNALGTNALGTNALGNNALGSNALGSNALGSNALGSNALGSNGLAAVTDPSSVGTLARSFVHYLVACAYRSSQSFQLSWTDSDGVVHDEVYRGEFGLAPEWMYSPIETEGKRMVSACMAAHVNYYGTHVTISVRSGEEPLRLDPHDGELDDFSKIEGAFWGDLWSSNPYINACYNSANRNNSRAQHRDCAAGHLNPDGTINECGIINIVGDCSSVCKEYNRWRGFYEDCRDQPGVNNKRTDYVITTALP